MSSGGFSSRIRARPRRGARLEPRSGWRLGIKTSRAPDGTPEDPPASDDERKTRQQEDARRRQRLSDSLDRRDRADLALGADDDLPGKPLVRRRRGGMEPRTAHHGDPVEDRRASYSPSTSVWAQDPRAQHLIEEARELEYGKRLGFEGQAAVHSLRQAVVDGTQALVELRWGPLTDRSVANAQELEYQASKPRLDDDGSRPQLSQLSALGEAGHEVVPPLSPSLRHVGCDPALLALAAARYEGADLEPPVLDSRAAFGGSELDGAAAGVTLPQDPHSVDVQSAALPTLERALADLEQEHLSLCRLDPLASDQAERDWARGRVSLAEQVRERSLCPEEGRMLLEGMDRYDQEHQPLWENARYLSRVHIATGRDPLDGVVSEEQLHAVLSHSPSLVEGIRELDPDSPLLVVPDGMDVDAVYQPLLEDAIDVARHRALSSDLAADVPPLSDICVAVADECQARREAGDLRLPTERVRTPLRSLSDPLEGADARLQDLVDGCAGLGAHVRFDDLNDPHSGIRVVPTRVAGRDLTVVQIDPLCAPEEVAAAVVSFGRSWAPALLDASPQSVDDSLSADRQFREDFAVRMAARVSGLPLDDRYLEDGGRRTEAQQAALGLVSDVLAAAPHHRRHLQDDADRFHAAGDRLQVVVRGLEARGVQVSTTAGADHDPVFRASLSADRAGSPVVDLGPDQPLKRPHELSQEALREYQAQAYVVLARAFGASSTASPERQEAFRHLHVEGPGSGPSTADARWRAPDGGVDSVALREQVVVDLVATDHMTAAWGDSSSAVRTVQRGPDGGQKLVVPDEQRADWPRDLKEHVDTFGKKARADGNIARNWSRRILKAADKVPQSLPGSDVAVPAQLPDSKAPESPSEERRPARS